MSGKMLKLFFHVNNRNEFRITITINNGNEFIFLKGITIESTFNILDKNNIANTMHKGIAE